MIGPGEELLQIADAAADARARMTTEIGEPLARILHSAEEAARAWSGSNIGYQTTGLLQRPLTKACRFRVQSRVQSHGCMADTPA
jgi:hypothetical protein